MKNYLKIMPIILFSFACENESIVKDQPNFNTDSSNTSESPSIKFSSAEQAKRWIDSISKAHGGNVSVVMEASHDGEKIQQEDLSELKAEGLQVINSVTLDSLLKHSKKKYTMLHFWATWCTPCRKEFPAFVEAVGKLKNTDVILVSSDYDTKDQRKKVLSFYHKLNTKIPLYIAETAPNAELTNRASQIRLIHKFDQNADGGLPYNLLIENKTRKVVGANSNYEVVLRSAN